MKGILAIVITINIILITFMTFFVDPIHQYTYEEYRVSVEGENPELEAELKVRIYPENREKIAEKYNGNVDLNYMYEKLYDLVHTNLPLVQNEIKDMGITKLQKYLEDNQNKMLVYFGITNIEQLSKLATNIKDCNIKEDEYVNSSYIEDTFLEDDEYDSFNICLNYQTCKLYFKVYVANSILTSPMVIFDSISGGAE